MRRRVCKDCLADNHGATRQRPAPHPGPRCATHHRIAQKRSQAASHGRRVEKTYGIPAEAYWTLYEAQGGVCFICRRATGKTKRLAVDHDHTTGEVRGLLCGPCNQMLGRLGVHELLNALDYLHNPPARKVLTCPTSAGDNSTSGATMAGGSPNVPSSAASGLSN